MRNPTKADSFKRIKSCGIPIETILDVGVLSGTSELIQAFPSHRHVLFEPIVEWNQKIAHNYCAVNHDLHNVAVADTDGFVQLELSTVIANHPITHARIKVQESQCTSKNHNIRRVESVRLDSFVAKQNLLGPYLLKIDVDGAEILILEGARGMLERCNVVIIEAGIDNFLHRAYPLEKAGFQLFDLVDLAYYDDRLAQFDMIFLNGRLMREKRLGLYEAPFDFSKWHNYRPAS